MSSPAIRALRSADSKTMRSRTNLRVFISIGVGVALVAAALLATSAPAVASKFTPLEWQQRVEKHADPQLVGQRKHTTWSRDLDRNFIDDAIEARYSPGELVDVIVTEQGVVERPDASRMAALMK